MSTPPVIIATGGRPPNQVIISPWGKPVRSHGMTAQIEKERKGYVLVLVPSNPIKQAFRRCSVRLDTGSHHYCLSLKRFIEDNLRQEEIRPNYTLLRQRSQLEMILEAS